MKNEPAFPTSNGGSPDDGMTLRDYFAGQAMQGFLATGKSHYLDEHIALDAYNLADAMLKQREEE